MAGVVEGENVVYTLFFIGNGTNPRDGFDIMGTPDVWFRFVTPHEQLDPIRTTIRGLSGDIATFDWTLRGAAVGTATILDPPRRFHMHDLVLLDEVVVEGQIFHCRAFYSASAPTLPRLLYRWVRRARDAYELYVAHDTAGFGTLIGSFAANAEIEQTAAGPAFASFSYNFDWHDPLVLDAMLALCVNRFLDRMQASA
ncbi:hypothetical protein BV25DRAFT_1917364 [Artomyces pyxidatus]|uniref:Uncharacterized protein n=1 Tax=Artomyces pyxidatus TaxID=48021 RepID=A0ACB8SXD1_9AGAM|nr:hypothetical protein BV25DRAFT_1917364 [Artomyces pyxidatus]